jgi:hypothetical protein
MVGDSLWTTLEGGAAEALPASEDFHGSPNQVDCYQCGLPEWLEEVVVEVVSG